MFTKRIVVLGATLLAFANSQDGAWGVGFGGGDGNGDKGNGFYVRCVRGGQ